MGIREQEFIFLDFQTTGTVAARSEIVEAGWGLYRADQTVDDKAFESYCVSLPEGRVLSRTIQKLTGLPSNYTEQGPSLDFASLQQRLSDFLSLHENKQILMHYAQFKNPFLAKVLGEEAFPKDRIVCLHKLSKHVLPGLKSYSLRAVAGYLGYSTQEKKRSLDHLKATATIWQHLAQEIPSDAPMDKGIASYLNSYKPEASEKRSLAIQGEDLRKKRLALPKKPGVYFFLDRFQNILYVGKALNLHHRVNSYFRGRKTKGSRLNEMLTRAEDFRFIVVQSELEALLRENDEIKRHDPPYNRLLREEGRELSVFNFSGLADETQLWRHRQFGPLSSNWMVEFLLPLVKGEDIRRLIPSYRLGLSQDIMSEGLKRLFASYGQSLPEEPKLKDWYELARLAWPLEYERLKEKQAQSYRESLEEEDETEEEEADETISGDEDENESLWTPEAIEGFLRDALLGLYRSHLKSRWLLRLCDCRIHWQFAHTPLEKHIFEIRKGEIQFEATPWESSGLTHKERMFCLNRLVYDRLSIIYAELKKGLRRGDMIHLELNPILSLDHNQLKTLVRP